MAKQAAEAARRRSILISWLGYKNGLVKQDLVRVRRGETPEQTVEFFVADKAMRGQPVARIVGWAAWS